MPLASLFCLQFYGPCAASAVGTVAPTADATLRKTVRLGGVNAAVASSPLAKLTGGRKMAAVNTAVASSPLAQLRQRYRMGAVGKVNELSQDDVTGAVLEAPVEAGFSLKQAIRLLLAVAVGKTDIDTSGPDPIIRFRDLNDSKDRITATMTGSERTTVVKDAT
jgi:hypothetical protein